MGVDMYKENKTREKMLKMFYLEEHFRTRSSLCDFSTSSKAHKKQLNSRILIWEL